MILNEHLRPIIKDFLSQDNIHEYVDMQEEDAEHDQETGNNNVYILASFKSD